MPARPPRGRAPRARESLAAVAASDKAGEARGAAAVRGFGGIRIDQSFISNHDSVQPSGRGFGGVHRRSADNRLKVTALVVHGSVRPVRLADRLPLPGPEPPVVDRGGDRRLGDERQVHAPQPDRGERDLRDRHAEPRHVDGGRRLVRPDVRQRNRHAEHAEELAREGDLRVAGRVERPRRSTRDPLEDDGDAGRVHERDRDRHLGALRALREQRHDVACEDGRQRREDHVRRHGKADDVAGVRLRLCGVLAAELLPDQTGGGEPEAPAGGVHDPPDTPGDDERGDGVLAEHVEDGEHWELRGRPHEVARADRNPDLDEVVEHVRVHVRAERVDRDRELAHSGESPPQEPDRERGDGEHVREDGTERGALDAPPQPEDERGAEHDVRDRAAGSNLHRGVGVVAADQHPAADEVERGEWNAEPDDPEVVGAERDRGLVAAQHVDETRRERPEGDRDGDRDHDSEEDARPDGVAQFRVRLRAEPLGD